MYASPTVGFTAQGTLRVVSPDGREFWRSPRSENRVEYDGMANVLNLGMDVTRRIAGLVDAWVMDLQSLPVARYASGATPAVSGAAADSAMWNVVRYSTVIAEYQRYLEKFPNGVFATLAEQQMRNLVLLGQPEGRSETKTLPLPASPSAATTHLSSASTIPSTCPRLRRRSMMPKPYLAS